MKIFLFLIFVFSFSFVSDQQTVDTYDWSNYEQKSKAIGHAMGKVTEAHVILFDDYHVDFDGLPTNTKSQLAILNDAAYLEWRVAEEALGKEEAAKYWDQFKNKDFGNLKCYESYEIQMMELLPKSYSNIQSCELPTRTECHLVELKKQIALDVIFNDCIKEKFGENKFTFTNDPAFSAGNSH